MFENILCFIACEYLVMCVDLYIKKHFGSALRDIRILKILNT